MVWHVSTIYICAAALVGSFFIPLCKVYKISSGKIRIHKASPIFFLLLYNLLQLCTEPQNLNARAASWKVIQVNLIFKPQPLKCLYLLLPTGASTKTEKTLNKTICVRLTRNKWVFRGETNHFILSSRASEMTECFQSWFVYLLNVLGSQEYVANVAALREDTWYKAGFVEGISVSVNQRSWCNNCFH